MRYDELIDGHDPMPRITRSADDIFLLYTGGTTGMPKGVIFRLGFVDRVLRRRRRWASSASTR